MKRGLLLISILVLATILISCSPTEKVVPKVTAANNQEQSTPSDSGTTVKITSSGFEPKTLTVKVGTKVTFVNKDSAKHWPASAMHPTHTLYPGSSITKCGTSEQSKTFDACHGLAPGESFSFTFNEKGSWKYHDHLSISSTGTVVVE